MTEKYVVFLPNNKWIDNFLIKNSNTIAYIESILEDQIKMFERVDSMLTHNLLNFGNKIDSLEQVKPIFEYVKELFFNNYYIKLNNDPKLELVSENIRGLKKSEEEYGDKTITMVTDVEVKFKTTLIHGYVHFIIEEIYGHLIDKYFCFEEGLASFISEEMAYHLHHTHNDLSYLYDLLEDAVYNLWEYYCWLTKYLKIKKNDKIKKLYPFDITRKEKRGRRPDQYSRGYTYFKIQQKINPNLNWARYYLNHVQ